MTSSPPRYLQVHKPHIENKAVIIITLVTESYNCVGSLCVNVHVTGGGREGVGGVGKGIPLYTKGHLHDVHFLLVNNTTN